MIITEERVREIAKLANLQLTADEVRHLAHDLGEVLTHMEQLESLNTDGVEPMAQVLFDAGERATLRQDAVRLETVLGTQAALANAPTSGSGHFKLPKVIER